MKHKNINKLLVVGLVVTVAILYLSLLVPVNAEIFNGQPGYASIDSSGTTGSYLIIGTSDTSYYQSIALSYGANISNLPTSIDFGMVMPSTTYYAYNLDTTPGYSNPVTALQCGFTVTNNSSTSSVNLAMSCTNATGGNTWTLVHTGTPTGDQFEVVAVIYNTDPATGLVLQNGNQSFYTGLAALGTLQWDFKEILGGTGIGKAGSFSDASVKTYYVTITGS
jgi:hypothetical protein